MFVFKYKSLIFEQKKLSIDLHNKISIQNLYSINIYSFHSNRFNNIKKKIITKNKNNSKSLYTYTKKPFTDSQKLNCNKISEINSEKIEKEFLKLDYYSMLNIKHIFTEAELRKNYYQLAKHFHPDRFKGTPEIFKKLTEAYQTLKDNNKKDEYNRKLKIKIHKHYKKNKEENQENYQEELRNTSKYEEDFKKLNIEKLFHDFSKKKIRTCHEKIKTYKSNLEKKMNQREFNMHEFVLEFKQNQILNDDKKYLFYKKFGLIKENNIEKNYSELVKEEINRIKNKNILYEKIKDEEKKEKNKDEVLMTRFSGFVKRIIIFYSLSLFFLLLYKHNNKKINEESMKKKIEQQEKARFSNYIYIGNSKI